MTQKQKDFLGTVVLVIGVIILIPLVIYGCQVMRDGIYEAPKGHWEHQR